MNEQPYQPEGILPVKNMTDTSSCGHFDLTGSASSNASVSKSPDSADYETNFKAIVRECRPGLDD